MVSNILVVDDSHVERVLVKGLLQRNPDYHVELAVDGSDAWRKIVADPPHLVITDLVMPEMDGLELVQRVRQRYPQIPVVLMTAYGDESTAGEALDAGAASYIPKAQKAERLMLAVDRVLRHATADRNRQRLAHSVLEYHCRFALENDRQLIRAMVDEIQQAMAGIGFTDTVERIRTGEALEEAMLNAMYHGNLEVNQEELAKVWAELDENLLDELVEERCQDAQIRQRRMVVVVHLTKNEARFVIRDEGRGFRPEFFGDDRSDRFECGRHRGQTLIHSLMDEVIYNKAGNELVLRKLNCSCTRNLSPEDQHSA